MSLMDILNRMLGRGNHCANCKMYHRRAQKAEKDVIDVQKRFVSTLAKSNQLVELAQDHLASTRQHYRCLVRFLNKNKDSPIGDYNKGMWEEIKLEREAEREAEKDKTK